MTRDDLCVEGERKGKKIAYAPEKTYTARHGELSAELVLTSKDTDVVAAGLPGFRKFVGAGKGKPYYYAEITFSERVYDLNESADYRAVVSIQCGCQSITGIFERLKYNEAGIEGLLAPDKSDAWKLERDVIGCILKLEDEVQRGGTV